MPGRKVLVVDDTSAHRKLYASWLKIGGYTSRTLADERRTLAVAAEMQPDLVIVDVLMPRTGGLDVIEELKSHETTRHIPVLALTVLDSRSDEEACYAAGADAFVSKPINLEPFLRCIARLCAEGARGG